jgi:hypothetical protein
MIQGGRMQPVRGFVWGLRVRSAGKDRATVYVRQRRFEVGAPLQFDQEYDAVTALEHALAAIGADLVNGLRALARRRRVEVEEVEATVEGVLNNPLVHLGVVGETGHPGLETVTVKVYVRSLAPEEKVHEVWKETLEKSPLVHTFEKAAKLDLSMQVVI